MSKRPRRTSSYRPGTSELEKVQGASTFVTGDLAAALSLVDLPAIATLATAPLAPRADTGPSAGQATSARISSPTSPTLPEITMGLSRAVVGSRSSPSKPLVPAATPADTVGSGLIRPLSLAPDSLPEAPSNANTDAPVPQPLRRAANVVDVGANVPLGSATIVMPGGSPVASPASGGAQGSAQAATAGTSGAQGSALGAAVIGALDGGNPGVSVAASNAIAARVPHENNAHHARTLIGTSAATGAPRTSGNPTGGIPFGDGYAATGGDSHRGDSHRAPANSHQGSGVHADVSGAGSSSSGFTGPATGTLSGTSSDAFNSSPSEGTLSSDPSVVASTSGTHGFTDPGMKWSVQIQSGGLNVIGGPASFQVNVSPITAPGPGENTGKVTTVTWSSDGAPVMYLEQKDPPNTADKQFVNQPYDISAQTGQPISFYWGEKPGVETLKAKVTIQGGFGQATATAEDKFTVLDPGWTGKVFALKSASIQKLPEDPTTDWLVYESPTQTPGITWSPAPKIQMGTFQVVQIMTSGTVTYSNPNYNPPWTRVCS